MSSVSGTSISVQLGGAPVLAGVSLHAGSGEVVAVVGPNGAGKTTLLRCLAGEAAVDDGTVSISDRDPRSLPPPDRAALRAFLTQTDRPDVPYDVRTVIGFGTHVSTLDADDQTAVVERCMAEMELMSFDGRIVSTLSGGERRRVSLARTFAQSAGAILLDEPTDSLDFGHADMAMEAASSRAREGAAVVLTTHDIDLAAKHATRIAVLHGGSVVADGPPADVLTSELLSAVYRCRIDVGRHPIDGRPVIFR